MTGATDIVPGLCSVAFRALDIGAVAQLAADCDLAAIEWGGDVHVPPGDIATAIRARRLCEDLGVTSESYGTYLTAGRLRSADEVPTTLDTALALGAPNVRVWAQGGSVVADLEHICAEARIRDLVVSVEFHVGTATETAASTNALLDKVAADNLWTYWQPNPQLGAVAALAELDSVLPRVSHLHVFCWEPDYTRRPLEAGANLWPEVLGRAVRVAPPVVPRVAFVEFVRDDDPAQLRLDAMMLHAWQSELGGC